MALVACCKRKLDHTARAKSIYKSPLFVLSRRYAEAHCGRRWYILSAKHGLLSPDEIVEPYDTTLGKFNQKELVDWGEKVAIQIQGIREDADERILFLGGVRYFWPFNERVRNPVDHLLGGMGIGMRLKWLREQTRR